MNFEEEKRNQNWKRKRHIKKTFSRYIKNEERTLESHTFIDYLKNRQLDVLFNIAIAIVVSVLCCGCFFALIPIISRNGENFDPKSMRNISHGTQATVQHINYIVDDRQYFKRR